MENSIKTLFLKMALLTLVISCAGIALLELNLVPYGFTLFCVMPVIVGYAIGQMPKFNIILSLGGVLGVILFLYLMIVAGLESFFCVITLLPLLMALYVLGIYIGLWIRLLVDKNKKRNKEGKTLGIYLFPVVLLFISGILEKFFTEKYTTVSVETTRILPYSKERVFNYVKSFDTLNSKKSFLLKLGLPVPVACVLEKDSVGAKRVCYFEEGTIDEIVTDFKPGEILKMKITKFNMPGRKWLHFENAIYLFQQDGTLTWLTRITTYKTELKPRFYWSFWEKKAIVAEHEYVLNDLRRRLDEAAMSIK